MKDLKEKTLRGGLARLVNQCFCFLLRLGSMAVLARLLNPQDFGLVAMATVITGTYGMFTTAGLSCATVQRESVTKGQVSNLFWVNIAVGVALCVLCLLTAPLLVFFYNEPRLFWITTALAAGFMFNAAGVQHNALLQREMRFSALAVIEAISLSASIAVAVAIAFHGWGYWALVWGTLTNTAVSTICKWKASGWIPGKPSRGQGVLPMIKFGGTLTLSSFVSYISCNLDKVIVGRFWGAGVLGFYVRAYNLINEPADSLNSTVASVAFSALARLQSDHQLLKKYFLKGYSLVVAMTVPIAISCALFADEIVRIFLGPKWHSAAVIFRLMTPAVLAMGVLTPLGWFLQSMGIADRNLKISLVIGGGLIISCLVAVPYGAAAVAFASSLAAILMVVPILAWSISGTIFTAKDIVSTVTPPIYSGLVASVATLIFRLLCDPWLSTLPMAAVGLTVLMVIYFWFLLFVMGQKSFYLDLFNALKSSVYKTEPAI